MEPATIQIRPAQVSDAPAIGALHVRAWQWAYRGQIPDEYLDRLADSLERRVDGWRQSLERSPSDEKTWVADRLGEIVGFVRVGPSRDADAEPGTGEVQAIYLDQSVVGQGVGRALLATAVDQLREQGFRQATLWVLESNTRARRFYERNGWAPDGAVKCEERPGFVLKEMRYRIDLASR